MNELYNLLDGRQRYSTGRVFRYKDPTKSQIIQVEIFSDEI